MRLCMEVVTLRIFRASLTTLFDNFSNGIDFLARLAFDGGLKNIHFFFEGRRGRQINRQHVQTAKTHGKGQVQGLSCLKIRKTLVNWILYTL